MLVAKLILSPDLKVYYFFVVSFSVHKLFLSIVYIVDYGESVNWNLLTYFISSSRNTILYKKLQFYAHVYTILVKL